MKVLVNLRMTEKYCRNKAGFCQFMRVNTWKGQWRCSFFEDKELHDDNGIPSGPARLVRLPECKKKFKEV